jgi:hypothetical protein
MVERLQIKTPAVLQSSIEAVAALRNSLADVLTKAISDGCAAFCRPALEI